MKGAQARTQNIPDDSHDIDKDDAFPITSNISEKAEPYFEYSVFQKTWGSGQLESEIAATEITLLPFTNIHHANTHAHKRLHDIKEQYMKHFQYQVTETASKRNKHDCETHTGAFTSIDNPDKVFHAKLWVQRDEVSAFANEEPAGLKFTPFIMKSVFVLRLFKLVPTPGEASSKGTNNNVTQTRVYHPLPRTEVYTTLEAANRGARNVHIDIALSHGVKSADEARANTRELNIRELNVKLHELDGLTGGNDGYWKSQFYRLGQPGEQFELVVEEVGLCGPRNL